VSDRIFLRLGVNGALGADEPQWILYRTRLKEPPPLDAPPIRRDWNPVLYVRSTKSNLARFIREYSIELSPDGRIALDRLPDSFDAWRADPAQGALRYPRRRPDPSTSRKSPLARPLTGHLGLTP
jgi:hypothetical protein